MTFGEAKLAPFARCINHVVFADNYRREPMLQSGKVRRVRKKVRASSSALFAMVCNWVVFFFSFLAETKKLIGVVALPSSASLSSPAKHF
jgi:hypothetical protein